jgi:palmitoyltransferase
MRAEVRSVLLFCRGFYLLMHSLVFTVLHQFPTSAATSELTALLVVKAISAVLFFTTGTRPGFVRLSMMSVEMQEVGAWAPPKQFCEECEIYVPYRAKHCKQCEECVAKFDHHCFWLGSCVGQLNHFRFVLYLVLESIALDWIAYLCFDSFGMLDEAAGAYVICFLISGGFGLLTSCLGAYHLYLVSIGSTTWEQVKRPSYLHPYPTNFNPFDHGVLKNWLTAATSTRLEDWSLPEPLAEYPFNWCDNEYWVCC